MVTGPRADWSWAGPMIDTRPLFPVERNMLLDLLGGLDAAEWQLPTVCPGWNVHDVTGHLLHDYLRGSPAAGMATRESGCLGRICRARLPG